MLWFRSCVLVLSVVCGALRAQMVELGTVAAKGRDAIRAAFAAGVPPAPERPDPRAPSRFRRSAQPLVLQRLAEGYASEAPAQAELLQLFTTTMASYDAGAAASGLGNDMAASLAMVFVARQTLAGKPLAEGADEWLARQLQAVCDTDAVAALDDREKQRVFEWSLATGALLLGLREQANGDRDTLRRFTAVADQLLGDVFGVAGDTLRVGARGLKPTRAAGGRPASRPARGAASRSTSRPAPTGADAGTPLPPPEVPLPGERQSWAGWSFHAPAGWQGEAMADGYLLRAPKTNAAAPGFTFVCLLPIRAAGRDPYAQCLEILGTFFKDSFSGYRDHEFDDPDPLLHKTRGTTADGWRYVFLRTRPLDQQGGATGHQARILLFQLGDQVAPLLGFENQDERTLEDRIGGTRVAWPLLLCSIAFPGRTAPRADPRAQLLGTWHMGGSNYMLEETFQDTGDYVTASAYRTARELNATQVLERTTSWFGEGRFVVRGSQLAVWPLKGKPRTSYWYVDEEANSACASGWLRRLHRIQLTYDGKAAYESALVQRQ